MKKLSVIVLALLVVSAAANAQSSQNVAVSLAHPELLNLTLSANTVDLGTVQPNTWYWSAAINATMETNIQTNVAVQVRQLDELKSGTTGAGYLSTQGTGGFLHTSRVLTSTAATIVSWPSPGSTETGTVQIGYFINMSRPAGIYSATVVYSLIKT